jgi:hypothetical protein
MAIAALTALVMTATMNLGMWLGLLEALNCASLIFFERVQKQDLACTSLHHI